MPILCLDVEPILPSGNLTSDLGVAQRVLCYSLVTLKRCQVLVQVGVQAAHVDLNNCPVSIAPRHENLAVLSYQHRPLTRPECT